MENKQPRITVRGEDYKLQELLSSTSGLVIQALRYRAQENNIKPADHLVVFSRYTEKFAFRIDLQDAQEISDALKFILEGYREQV